MNAKDRKRSHESALGSDIALSISLARHSADEIRSVFGILLMTVTFRRNSASRSERVDVILEEGVCLLYPGIMLGDVAEL